jgi:hypothetical protein
LLVWGTCDVDARVSDAPFLSIYIAICRDVRHVNVKLPQDRNGGPVLEVVALALDPTRLDGQCCGPAHNLDVRRRLVLIGVDLFN